MQRHNANTFFSLHFVNKAEKRHELPTVGKKQKIKKQKTECLMSKAEHISLCDAPKQGSSGSTPVVIRHVFCYSTFHHVLLRIDKDSQTYMVVNFEHLYRLKSNKIQPRVFKLLDGVHLVPLHHYLLLTIHLNKHRFFCLMEDELLVQQRCNILCQPDLTWAFFISLGSSRLPVWVWKV